MGTVGTEARGDGFLARRLERVYDMVLRRRVGMRDWCLAAIVVTIPQITGTDAIGWGWYAVLLGVVIVAASISAQVYGPRGPNSVAGCLACRNR